jgi:uncharacterized protein (DUF488 family)
MLRIYTIGHSNHKIEYFIDLLKIYSINCVVDVRSVPFSKYVSHFNKSEIKISLNMSNILYIFMGKELGARRENKTLYTNGYLDFEKVSQEPLFQNGIKRLVDGLNKNYNIALMCSEKDPIDCHRNILVARELSKKNIEIYNIMDNKKIETQKKIEERLVNVYFPNRKQLSLFEEPKSHYELINRAYKLANEKIAYSKEKIRA